MTKPIRRAIFFLPVLLLFLSLLFPGASRSGVEKGLELVLYSALPSLFPALVLSRVITGTVEGNHGKSVLFLPFFLGAVCGFPVGAFVVAKLVENQCISKKDGERFLFFCNNAGPAFLVNLCGKDLFGSPSFGWYLFGLQSFFSLILFLLFFGKRFLKKEVKKPHSASLLLPFSQLITESLSQSAKAFSYIAACILFFSFLSSMAKKLLCLTPLGTVFISLFFELTGGVSSLSPFPFETAFPLCAAGVGWSGISVQLQVLGIIKNAKLSPKYLFAGKISFAALLFLSAKILQKCL